MILNENFASIAHHYDFARRAQAENPFTHQNQVVELQKVVIQTQNRAQTVPDTKSGNQSSGSFPFTRKVQSTFSHVLFLLMTKYISSFSVRLWI